jgi:hypothetical protein
MASFKTIGIDRDFIVRKIWTFFRNFWNFFWSGKSFWKSKKKFISENKKTFYFWPIFAIMVSDKV